MMPMQRFTPWFLKPDGDILDWEGISNLINPFPHPTHPRAALPQKPKPWTLKPRARGQVPSARPHIISPCPAARNVYFVGSGQAQGKAVT